MASLKSCPRCGGYLHTSQDMYGVYTECLQCGYMVDLVKAPHRSASRPRPVTEEVA